MSRPDPRTVPAAHSMDTAWFGVDEDGNLALFDTGEAGALPLTAASTRELDLTHGGPTDGFAAIAKAVGLPDDWWEGPSTERFFRFEHDTDNWAAGRYVRNHRPLTPIKIDELPPALHHGIIRLPVNFATTAGVQPVEHTECEAWGPVWISADGKEARPFPGEEEEAAEEWAKDGEPHIRFIPDAGPAAAFVQPPPAEPSKPWWKIW